MAELLLVNPRRRRKAGKKKSTRSTARKHVRRARRKNPVRRLRARKSSVRKYVAKRATKRRSTRRRHNPIGLPSMGGVMGTVIGSGKGALGAIANDALMTYVPLPLMLKTGMVGQLSRAVMAFLLGWGASKVAGKSIGADFTRGALTVQIYALAKPMISQFVPLADGDMGDVGYYNPGTVLSDGMGQYLSGTQSAPGPWGQNIVGGDDADAFAGMGDSMGYYAQ